MGGLCYPGDILLFRGHGVHKRTLSELERIQCMVGKFILQVPASMSNVLVWCDAGLMPIKQRIQCRQVEPICFIYVRKRTVAA
jgi:hypothetical protein